MPQKNTEILILGGGYSGMMAAVRLAGKSRHLEASITLINANDHFVERPRLHEKAAGARLREKPISRMLEGTGARFIRGWVSEIDPDAHRVRITSATGEHWLGYDSLVLALGSTVERHRVPGVDRFAYTLDPGGDRAVDALKARLDSLADRPFHAVVVGGGATGIEVAAQLKGTHAGSRVTLVTQGEAGAFKEERIRRHILDALSEQSIDIREQARVKAVEADGILLGSEKVLADLVIWAGGFTAPALGRQAGLEVNRQNQVLVDPFLRSLSQPDVYAVGDAACPVAEPGAPWRMSLFTALVSGAQAADNILATLQDRPPRPLSYAWYGQAIALGPDDAVGFSSYPADIPWKLVFRRTAAVKLRSFFIWYLGAALEIERRVPGAFFWNGRQRFQRSAGRAPDREQQEQVNYRWPGL